MSCHQKDLGGLHAPNDPIRNPSQACPELEFLLIPNVVKLTIKISCHVEILQLIVIYIYSFSAKNTAPFLSFGRSMFRAILETVGNSPNFKSKFTYWFLLFMKLKSKTETTTFTILTQ